MTLAEWYHEKTEEGSKFMGVQKISSKKKASIAKMSSAPKKTTKHTAKAKPRSAVSSGGGESKSHSKNKNPNTSQSSLSSSMTIVTHSSEKKSHAGYLNSKAGLENGAETVCREVACEGLATTGGYCRLHYIKNWKKIKRKEVILREKKLNQYIEELVAKYPDKYIEAIRQDLASDKDFAKVIYDLDLDEGIEDFDVESGDSVDNLIDTIKRDFDDEGDAF